MGKSSAFSNLLIPAAVPVLGVLVAILLPGASPGALLLAPLLVCGTGGVLIAISKLPRIAAGQVVSFGVADLPRWARSAYLFGYFMLVLGAAATVALAFRVG